jgi:hypothetical protein
MSREAWTKVLIGALLLFGVVTRFVHIDAQGIKIDETWVVPTPNFRFEEPSIYPKLFEYPQYRELSPGVQHVLKAVYDAHPVFQIVAIRAASDVHPPFYFILNYYWSRVFGYDLSVVRTPAALYFVLTTVLLFVLLREQRVGTSVKVLALLLVVLSPFYLFLSNFARPYTLLLLLCLLSTYLAYRIASGGSSPRALWGYGAVAVAALYTHYYAAFVVASQALYLLFESSHRKSLRRELPRYLLVYAGVGLAFAPWAVAILLQMKTKYPGIENVGGFQYFNFAALWELVRFFGPAYSRSTADTPLNAAVSSLQLIFVLVGAVSLWRTRESKVSRFWLFFLIVPLVLAGIPNLIKPVFSVRNFSIVLVPYFVVCAFGLASLRRRVRWAPVAVLAGVGAYFVAHGLAYGNVKGKMALEDWPGVAEHIERSYAGERPVIYVYHPSFRDALYYYIPDEGQVRALGDSLLQAGPDEEQFLLVLMNHGLEPDEERVRHKVPFLSRRDAYTVRLTGEFGGAYVYEVARRSGEPAGQRLETWTGSAGSPALRPGR